MRSFLPPEAFDRVPAFRGVLEFAPQPGKHLLRHYVTQAKASRFEVVRIARKRNLNGIRVLLLHLSRGG